MLLIAIVAERDAEAQVQFSRVLVEAHWLKYVAKIFTVPRLLRTFTMISRHRI